MHFHTKKVQVCVCARLFFVCWRSALDPTHGKLFALLCTKFPSRPQSFLSENDSGPAQRGRVVITCDITTLISSLVIVKSLWVERLNNGKECETRVCLRVCCCLKEAADGLWVVFITFA